MIWKNIISILLIFGLIGIDTGLCQNNSQKAALRPMAAALSDADIKDVLCWIGGTAIEKDLAKMGGGLEAAKLIISHVDELTAIYGAKAVSLFILQVLGLPVPSYKLVDVSLFDEFIKGNGLKDKLAYLKRTKQGNIDLEIEKLLDEAEFTTKQVERLRGIFDCFNGPVVIRSSAISENLIGKRERGVFKSCFLLRGRKEGDDFKAFLEKIKDVFASIFFFDAEVHRVNSGFNREDKMGLIIQEMPGKVMAEKGFAPFISGVTSVDPHKPDCIVSEMTLGLNNVVTGRAELRLYSEQVDNEEIVTAINPKNDKDEYAVENFFSPIRDISHLVLVEGEERIKEIRFTESGRKNEKKGLELKAIQRDTLCKAARTLKEVFGSPVEIEWSLQDSKVWFYQVSTQTTFSDMLDIPVELRQVNKDELLATSSKAFGHGEFTGPVIWVGRDLSPDDARQIRRVFLEGFILIAPYRAFGEGDFTGMYFRTFLPALRPSGEERFFIDRAIGIKAWVSPDNRDIIRGAHYAEEMVAIGLIHFPTDNLDLERLRELCTERFHSVSGADDIYYSKTPVRIAVDGHTRRGQMALLNDEDMARYYLLHDMGDGIINDILGNHLAVISVKLDGILNMLKAKNINTRSFKKLKEEYISRWKKVLDSTAEDFHHFSDLVLRPQLVRRFIIDSYRNAEGLYRLSSSLAEIIPGELRDNEIIRSNLKAIRDRYEAVERVYRLLAVEKTDAVRLNLRKTLEDIIALFSSQVQVKGIVGIKGFRTELEDVAEVEISPTYISQIITFLLNNSLEALKSLEEGKRLSISLKPSEKKDKVQIEITFSKGWSADYLKLLYNPDRKSEEFEFYVCRKIIQLAGGSFRVESDGNISTTITIELPAVKEGRTNSKVPAGQSLQVLKAITAMA